jgi:hypothetical protein
LRDESDGAVVTGGGALAMVSPTNAVTLTKLAAVANLGACLGAVLLATRMVFELH